MPAAPTPRPSAPVPPAARRGPVRGAIGAFLKTEDGPTAVEYAVMLAMILGAMFGTIGLVGGSAGGLFSNAESELESAGF